MSLFESLGTPSNESIDFQNKKFHDDLVKTVSEVRKNLKEILVREDAEMGNFQPLTQYNTKIRVAKDADKWGAWIHSDLVEKRIEEEVSKEMIKLTNVVRQHINMGIIFTPLRRVAKLHVKNYVEVDEKDEVINPNDLNVHVVSYHLNNSLATILGMIPLANDAELEIIEDGAKATIKLQDIKKKAERVGSVDLKTSKVHGLFAKEYAFISVGWVFLVTDILTDEEVAASLCHEIGHVFTNFEFVADLVTFNHTLRALVNTTVSKMPTSQKTVIFKEILEGEELSQIVDAKELAKLQSPNAVAAWVGEAKLRKIQSEYGLDQYDMTTNEGLADQFASRHHFNKALVSGLVKIIAVGGEDIKAKNIRQAALEKARIVSDVFGYGALAVGGIAGLTGIPVMVGVAVASGVLSLVARIWSFTLGGAFTRVNVTQESIHDSGITRLRRLKEDMIAKIKDPKLPKDEVQDALSCIAQVDRYLEGVKKFEGSTLDQVFFNGLFIIEKAFVKRDKQEAIARQLEELMNNDLFVRATELKLIADARHEVYEPEF